MLSSAVVPTEAAEAVVISKAKFESSEATHYLQIKTICYFANKKIRFALLETCKWLLWAHC